MRLSKQRKLNDLKLIEETWYTPAYRTAGKRAATMSTHDILEWTDVAGSAMAKAFSDYRKEKDPDTRGAILEELKSAISQMQAVTEELLFRDGIR